MGGLLGFGMEIAVAVLLRNSTVQAVPATAISIVSGVLTYAGWVQWRRAHVRRFAAGRTL